MGTLTIGAFARAARLSPKALRLYDELGLLRPARVDPVSGYRFYEPSQLERARLVAWLRRLGIPLARIRVVCDLPPAAAAREVAAYWAGVEADVAARRDLAAFLVDQALVDEGRLTPEEAASHPRRSLLLRALQGGGVTADLKLHEARVGDRYLLCSDGLSAVVPAAAVREALATASDPDAAVRRLVDLANDAGGPDNVTCVVADVTGAAGTMAPIGS